MSENTRPIYVADDFIRYHKGEMTTAEMHQLEKAALDDPFISDALDGYAFAAEKMKPVVLTTSNSSSASSAIVKPIRKWLAPLSIAASLLFILFAGYQFFNQKEINSETGLATTKKPAVTDSLSPVSSSSYSKGNFTEKDANELAAVIQEEAHNNESVIVKHTILSKKAITVNTESASLSEEPAVANMDLVFADQKSVAEDAAKEAIGSATGYVNNQAEVAADKDAAFLAIDSVAIASTTSTKAKMKLPAPVIVNNNTNNNWQGNYALNEVVVTGIASKKTKRANATAVSKVEAKQLAVTDEIEDANANLPAPSPINGWDAFYDYCKKNHQPCKQKDGADFHGSFKVSFYINDQGKPVQIKARTLSSECLKELKRMLSAAPQWTGNNAQKVEIRLEF